MKTFGDLKIGDPLHVIYPNKTYGTQHIINIKAYKNTNKIVITTDCECTITVNSDKCGHARSFYVFGSEKEALKDIVFLVSPENNENLMKFEELFKNL